MRVPLHRAAVIAAVALFAATACTLRPLPDPKQGCESATTLGAVWSCIDAIPRTPRIESGFRSTMRVSTDVRVRMRNQSQRRACFTNPPKGFERVTVDSTEAPLDAFYRAPDTGKPTIIVVHGIFDSRANRFMRIAMRRLAASGYGVLAPDMRWHGCLYRDDLPATLGILEAADLQRWSSWLRTTHGAAAVGLLGFSLGALDVIHAVSADGAAEAFRAGAIAVSPPAHLEQVLRRLDTVPTFSQDGRNLVIRKAMRRFLATRLRQAKISWTDGALFSAYLDNLAGRNLVGTTTQEILERAEPLVRVQDIRVPTLVLVAKNDPLFGELVSNAWAGSEPRELVHVIETRTGGHIGQMGEQPQWFSSVTTSFFDAVLRVAR
jgi:predicted alpha/beta-fold hydrolase